MAYREPLFWRIAFGVGFIVIGLGGLGDSPWAWLLVALGVGIIVWNVRRETLAKEAKRSAAAQDLAQWNRITNEGQRDPVHTHSMGDLPGVRSLAAHISVEHGQKATVDRITGFTTLERRPDVVTYGWLAQEHARMHEQVKD